mgnify:CR=1 FL=1
MISILTNEFDKESVKSFKFYPTTFMFVVQVDRQM